MPKENDLIYVKSWKLFVNGSGCKAYPKFTTTEIFQEKK